MYGGTITSKDISNVTPRPHDESTAQVYWSGGTMNTNSELSNQYADNTLMYRQMRFDPTIAFARMLTVAPLVQAGWSYEERPVRRSRKGFH